MVAHLTDWVSYNSRRYPSEIAVESLDTGEALTWAALEDRVARLATVFGDLGLEEGARVGVLADDDWRVLAVQFACMRTGTIYVPFNWRLTVGELEVLAKDADLALLVHDDTRQETATALAESVGLPTAGWFCDIPVNLDAAMDAAAPAPAPAGLRGDQLIQMLYTSGTTGLPKGALITMGGLVWHAANVQHEMAISGPPARYLSALPLFHAAGLNAITNPILMAGGRVSILRRFDPARAQELLGNPAHGVTHFNAAPVMWRMVGEAATASSRYDHIRAGMVGGGAIPADVGQHYSERGLELQAGWGATEMGPSTTLMPQAQRVAKAHTVGFPVQHLQLRVVDPETGLDVPPGAVGEAWVRGPSITVGYWRRPVEEDEATKAGWFKSGDAVSLDEDGYVQLRGRFKDMYKSGGENVFCAEVERVLVKHPDVQDAAVVGVPHERWGEVGYAVVIAEPGRTVDPDAVTAHVAAALARYKVPQRVIVVDELPRNVTGKVQKHLLREQLG